MTAGAAVTAIACALRSDGSAAVFYAVAGVVYRITRSGLGAWGAATAWSFSLASVSGLAALFDADYQVLVSGAESGGDAVLWATTFGVARARRSTRGRGRPRSRGPAAVRR